MSDIVYYYVSTSLPYKVESTEFLEELILLLYEGKAKFITDAQRVELDLPKKYPNILKKKISKYEERVPLYDIVSNRIYLIYKDNVYPRIHFDNYRFVDKKFYHSLVKIKNPSDVDLENIRILSNYDLDVLYKTYMKIFYESFVVNSFITSCRRPSFGSGMEHISPYYNINELYFLAYDWNLTNKATLSEKEINSFCKKISQYDIPAQILLDHQMYIYDSRAIGLVKHYSLFGSYYMNLYLRKYQCCLPNRSYEDAIRNLYLENQITIMIKLIKNAPPFSKDHTVYRFVEKDNYLRHLKIGDIYQDTGFMSTTRNPFYYKENYAFGYILIKVKLPKNVKGIGLCIESYSNFPKEEEIILPPTSMYRLDNVTDAKDMTHFHNIFNLKVEKKYEFTWVGNGYLRKRDHEIIIDMPGAYVPEIKDINLKDLLNDDNIKFLSISERLKYFRDTYVNVNNQFISTIENTKYIFSFESYDSTTVYKPFFYYEVSDGIMVTTANPKYGNINIMMEIRPEIHVNYYFRFSVTDPSIVVDLNRIEWMEWLSLFAYIIGSRMIVIHSNYVIQYNKDDTIEQKQNKTRYTFSQNIYFYMKYKKKMYDFPEVTPNFDYYQLDYLFAIPVEEIVKPTDRDELHRIYQLSGKKTVGDFYIYVIENFPKMIKNLEEKMDLIYENMAKNPFNNISYNLDAWSYLYNRNLIQYIPSNKEFTIKKGPFKNLIGDKKILKFKNRLRTFLIS
jgi:hypothetical protein